MNRDDESLHSAQSDTVRDLMLSATDIDWQWLFGHLEQQDNIHAQGWLSLLKDVRAKLQVPEPEFAVIRIVPEASAMSESSDPIMQFFSYGHLSPHLQEISKPYCELAQWMMENLPRNAERTVALRRLLEAKEGAVRAFVFKP